MEENSFSLCYHGLKRKKKFSKAFSFTISLTNSKYNWNREHWMIYAIVFFFYFRFFFWQNTVSFNLTISSDEPNSVFCSMENLLTWQKNFDPGRKAGKLTADLHLSLLQIQAPSLIPSSLADHLLQPPRSIFSGSHRFPADSKSSKDHTDSKHPSPHFIPAPQNSRYSLGTYKSLWPGKQVG